VTRVRLPPKVRRLMGAAGLSRNAVVRLLAWVHTGLPLQVNKFKHNRVAGRPEMFIARKVIVDGGACHCEFHVDDQTPDLLTVEDFACQRGTP
jgi:hypothetical protein